MLPSPGDRPRMTGRTLLAAAVALAADLLQIVLFPMFLGGAASPANTVLDLVVAVVMIALLGWHWALLPTFVAEMVPMLDLFPTWTAAVLFVATLRRMRPTVPVTPLQDGIPPPPGSAGESGDRGRSLPPGPAGPA